MATTKLAVHVQSIGPLDSHVILLRDSLMKQWKIPANRPLSLRFGSYRAEVRVIGGSRKATLRMSEPLARELGISDGAQLVLSYRKNSQSLQLGPLIGVLFNRADAASADRPFGANTGFCQELTAGTGSTGGIVYFFTPADLDSEPRSVRGWSYDGKWTRRTFPVPDVVYNRLTNRNIEKNDKVQTFFRQVKAMHGASVFNERFLNKTEVFQALKPVAEVQAYLPESYPMRKLETLKAMCAKYATVFIKPTLGSLGKGIIRVNRTESGYHCHFNQPKGTSKQSFSSLAKLYAAISPRVKRAPYQIQQGLNLLEAGGRPMDFRAVVQKNGKGEWKVTSIVGRIAGPGNFVSNIARGGTLATVPDAIGRSRLPAGIRTTVPKRLDEAATAIAVHLDQQLPEHFGEMGVDLAVDTTGRVWLLEVNSKPSKEDNTALQPDKIRPSVRRVLQYAQFLTFGDRGSA
ncbi:hypothetical protein J31TS4_15430 [Paenibacillus sp. J31TS4]|uniref:YheC/YheD family endospore coat-associated protein n=1 Tax=Paenibacillus sp. J31TS4 TaxID=2807195 RepID=UPI001B2A186C|nr:YheC/YheD family protein [Paenibacillus sp. J31TS4]GIP38263.1 hypothetical protein J31TS4_15430 [Paenibacillus sp. J31TS4]